MKKLLLFLASTSLITNPTSSIISCTNNLESALNNLLNFREIDYTDIENIPVLRQMQEDVIYQRNNYLAKIQKDFKEKYEEFYKSLTNRKILNVDMQQNTKVKVKSGLIDSVYLGQQPMGYYYPQATPLHEINRYEIPNFQALLNAGYTLYVNNSNSEQIQIVNLINSDTVEFENLTYTALSNENKTDCVYFKTTQAVGENTPTRSADLKFIAIKDKNLEDVIITKKNEYNNDKLTINIVSADPEISKSYLEYKMGDWLRYEYVNNVNVQAFEMTNMLLSYVELTGNFLSQLEAKKYNSNNFARVELLNGMFALERQRYDGVSAGATIYAAAKYGFNFELFTIMQNDQETVIYFYLDQNKGINEPIEKDLTKLTFTTPQRQLLNFNPYLNLNPRIVHFAQKVWKLYFKLDKLQKDLLTNTTNEGLV